MTASVVLFEPRSATAPDAGWVTRLEAARRRTRFVKRLKSLLVVAMVLVGGAVVFFIVLSTINPPPAIDPAQVSGQVRMTNPRFTGRDADGRPYVISAQAAERPEMVTSATAATELLAPRLDFTGENSPAATVEAARGTFDETARTLDLNDGVSFATDNGYRFESEHARVFVDDGQVVGDRMIMGEGPLGSIRAQGFEIRAGGDSVVFAGDVVARLYPDEAPEEVATSEPESAQLSRQGGPIDITADSTEFVNSENVNRWVGNVQVRQGDATLKADSMSIQFAAGEVGQARQIERIEVNGSVVYTTPLEIARGDRGVYLAATERITLVGDVSLIRGDSTLEGQQLVIDPREGRSSLTREDQSDTGGRVRGVLGNLGGETAPAEAPPETQPSESE
jgi:lipopolysaccharide export system protein LptC